MTHTPAPAHSAVVRVLTRTACMTALVAAATTYALLTAPAHTAHSDVCTAHSTQAECLPGLTHTAHTAPHRDITVTTTGHDTALAYTVRTYADAGIVRTHVKLY